MDVASGGPIDVSALGIGTACGGHATAAPDFEMFLTAGSSQIRVFFVADTAGEDSTLIVNTPDGDWICDDDYGAGLNPMLELAPAEAGTYDIWIGSYSADENVWGTLYITELNYTPDSLLDGGSVSGGDGLDYTLESNFGDVELGPGFWPDPHTVDVVSGGSIDVSALGIGTSCRGYATAAPDFELYLTGSFSELRVYFEADSPGDDTTLIINTPDGEWLCDDDSGGSFDPLLEFEPAAAGYYDIWIGSYSVDESVFGTLHITELG